uniref:Major facilitator superfamily (MFS) profile domain-containing protein n=1 Tax=Bracon brevicornis TaxID=1563983 RepID=A0A6V7JUH3_9HYME
MYSVGLGPCSHVVVTEVLSPDIASLGVSITMSSGFIVSFITAKAFPLIVDEFGDETAFFILAIFCGAILCLVYFYIPETKGKSMAAILKELNGEQISDNVVYNNSVNITANVAIEEVVRLPRN